MSFHRFPICKASGKARLGERKDVRLALRQADRNRSQAVLNEAPCSRREIRAYRCSDCNGGWHLTASPERLMKLVPAEFPEYANQPLELTALFKIAGSERICGKVA